MTRFFSFEPNQRTPHHHRHLPLGATNEPLGAFSIRPDGGQVQVLSVSFYLMGREERERNIYRVPIVIIEKARTWPVISALKEKTTASIDFSVRGIFKYEYSYATITL
jgi:hypothetical protein